jgi:hypothetical protein
MNLYMGIDIGIKNLAICIINGDEWKNYKNGNIEENGIKLWKIINVINEINECQSNKKNGEKCNKKAIWKLNEEYYCGTHKKSESKKVIEKKVKELNMKIIKKKIFEELDKIELINNVSTIAIENQPRINQQMKMLAASIESYFIIRQQIDKNREIKIISSPAKNKLKYYNGPEINTNHLKKDYDKRKYIAEKQVEYYIKNSPETLKEFIKNKKKDDLADALLHCILYIN